jgi:hypothetical protein
VPAPLSGYDRYATGPDATVLIATWLIPASRLPILRATLHDITTLIDELSGGQQSAVIAPTYTRIYAMVDGVGGWSSAIGSSCLNPDPSSRPGRFPLQTPSQATSSLGPMREVRILPVKCRSFFLEFRGLATKPWMSGWSRSVS